MSNKIVTPDGRVLKFRTEKAAERFSAKLAKSKPPQKIKDESDQSADSRVAGETKPTQ